MKKIYYSFILITLLSCSKINDSRIDENCLSYEPNYGKIYVNVTLNNQITSVPIEIKLNHFDTGTLLFKDTLYESVKIYEVDINNYYVVSAEYFVDGKRIISIDGGKVSTYKYNQDDGSVCWNLNNMRARVEL